MNVAVDSQGHLYIADTGNHRIRRVAAVGGLVPTVADEGRDGSSGDGLPRGVAVHQNFPNPFNAHTIIGYELPARSTVTLTIYNLLGQPVRLLAAGEQPAGIHRVVWDGRDDRGQPAASGVYVYRLTTGQQRTGQRMLLLR